MQNIELKFADLESQGSRECRKCVEGQALIRYNYAFLTGSL